MKFRSITIENVFSYYGETTFNFDNEKETITLIIGENGFGKTSFINSIKLALYGVSKDLLQIGSQSLTKSEFILGSKEKNFSGILNRKAKLEGMQVAKVAIEIDDDDRFTIERTFTFGEATYSEDLVLLDGTGKVIAKDSEAQDIINSKLSPTMASFFFFDGEKVQTIADFSHKEFTKMLEDVLELDIYDQMIKDAESIIRKITKNELNSNIQKEVEERYKQLEALKTEIAKTEERLKYEKNSVLKELQASFKQVEKRLKKLKSKFDEALTQTVQEQSKLQEEKRRLTQTLKQVTLVQLPLLLNERLAKKVKEDIDKNYRGKLQIAPELLLQKKAQLLELLGGDRANVANAFDKVFAPTSKEQSVTFADPYHIEKQYDSLPKIDLDKLLKQLSQNRALLIKTEEKLYSLEAQKENELKDAEVDRVLEKELLKKIGHQEAVCEALEEKLSQLMSQYKTLNSEYAKLTITEHKYALTQKKIEALKGVIEVSKQMKEKIKRDKRLSLEKSINEKFTRLKKEEYEADSIKLDENFNINLYDKSGHPMDILSSSSGQKQMIATALIWAISEYISEEIPMVIDTPLGRLDERNQARILTEFYPNASRQVIILPTPSELRHEGFRELKEHIEKIYLLSNTGSATTLKELPVESLDHITNRTKELSQ